MASFGIGNPFWMYMLPEYELEGYWVCSIEDNDVEEGKGKNTVMTDLYMPKGFDNYIQSVSIPQLSLDYDNTSYGLMTFKEKSAYDDVTLTFYDDVQGSCLGFFKAWLDAIYDEDGVVLKSNWRYETKRVIVKYFRQLFTGIKTIASYTMTKCLPKSLAEIDADEDGGERKTFSITLATQRVYTTTPKTKSSESPKYPHSPVFDSSLAPSG